MTNSFNDWCEENNQQDLLNKWDYDLNDKNPEQVKSYSKDEFYFKCNKTNHPSSKYKLSNIIRRNNFDDLCLYCNSFAQYGCNKFGKNFLKKYWDDNLNKTNPWLITKNSSTKVWIKCTENDCHGSYEVSCHHFSSNKSRCPYCCSQKICTKDSFVQYHIDNTDKNFLEKYWDFEKNSLSPFQISKNNTRYKVWIKCTENLRHKSYLVSCNNFTNKASRCPYCSGRSVIPEESLGSINEALKVWSNKNKKSIYEFSKCTNKIVWWKCNCGKHEDYLRKICNSAHASFICPKCVRERKESYLQEKVRLYLSNNLKYVLNHEHSCTIIPINPKTQFNMPFDNEVVELKLIIEVHGQQHYKTNAYKSRWRPQNLTIEEALHKRKLYDRYKKIVAISSGYFYLEIPYWADDKNETYKRLIDDKIVEISNIKR